jgi:amino acid transporter
MNNPLAFADAYFEINSLRVFTATGQIASLAGPEGLGAGAIAGIVVGAVAALLIAGALWWFLRRRRQA